MKRLVSTMDLSHREWLAHRKTGITGTDAGAIVGVNPYVSAFSVYQDKISDEVMEQEDNEAMRQGRDLEDYVARRFMEETGFSVRRANAIYQNEKYPFMIADFDRLVMGHNIGLECKTVSPYSADRWKDGIPPHYEMQCQHYLAVSGYQAWYIAALIFGQNFIIRRIDRDEEMIHDLISVEKRFWEYNIQGRHIPDPDGSDNYSAHLNKLFPCANKEKEIELFGVQEILKRRNEISELIARLEKEKSCIDQSIKQQMGDAAYGFAGDYRLYWTPTVQQRLDTKLLKEEAPEIYIKYLKESSTRRFMVKHVGKEIAA